MPTRVFLSNRRFCVNVLTRDHMLYVDRNYTQPTRLGSFGG
ncbi:hypothetical protein [Mesorhizobium sp. M1409]